MFPISASSGPITLTASLRKKAKNEPVRSKVSLEQLQSETEKRAKEIFHARSKDDIPGDDLSDWLQAEKEVKEKFGIKDQVVL